MRIILIAILASMTVGATAQKYSNEFLSIGVSAKAQAMGNAQAAHITDATAGFWNPAGLASLKGDLQVSLMHAEWFASIGKYDYLAVAKPLSDGKRTLGLSLIRFGIDNIPNTLSLYEEDGTINYDNITPFSAVDYAAIFSYAQKLGKEGLNIGGNVKIIHRSIGPFAKAWGFGLDVGLQYKTKDFIFGIMGKDITSTINAWSFSFTDEEKEILQLTGNEIPISSTEATLPRIILGAAYQKRFNKIGVLAELNIDVTTDGERNVLVGADPISFDPVFGFELDFNQKVFLRGGINTIQQETDLTGNQFWSVNPNVGVGVKLGGLRIDYAFSNVGEQSNNTYSHVVSLLLDVNFAYLKRAIKSAERDYD